MKMPDTGGGGPRCRDLGEGAVSYLGVVLLVAAVASVLITSGVGTRVSAVAGRAVCRVFQPQSGCAGGEDGPGSPQADTPNRTPESGRTPEGGRTPENGRTPEGGSRPPAANTIAREEDRPEEPLPPHPPTGTTIPETGETGGRTAEDYQGDLAEYEREYERLVRSVLGQSATGREALRYLDDHPIPIEYVPGEGSSYNGSRIRLDTGTGRTLEQIAGSLVHEIRHYRDDQDEGVPGPGDFDDRDDYFRAMADFEGRGEIEESAAVQELRDSRGYTGPLSLGERTYRQELRRERRENPDATEAQLDRAAREAAVAELREDYLDGTIVASTDGDPYTDEWQERWNRTHGSWSCRNLGLGC
jgi:hypothetical protein